MRLCNWYAGIDINSHAIVAAFGSSTDGQRPRVHGTVAFDLPHGSVTDLSRPVHQLADWLRRESGGNLDAVALSVPGNAIHEMPSAGEIRFAVPTMIDTQLIEAARQKALYGPERLGMVLCSTIRCFEFDGYRTSSPPLGKYATSLRVEIVAWVARSRYVDQVVDALAEARFQLGLATPRVVAIAESVLARNERDGGAIVIQVNDDFTEVATFAAGQLADLWTIPLGKVALETQLARACGISVGLVRQLDLKRIVESNLEDPVVHRVRTVLSAWGLSLFRAVRQRMEAGDLTWHVQSGVVIADSAESLPLLDQFGSRVMGTRVRFALAPFATAMRNQPRGESRAASGLIPLQWKTNGGLRDQSEMPLPAVTSDLDVPVSRALERSGIAPFIGRWLREFVPSDHSL
ncbi:MAG TPA: hypothetical protein VHV31_14875 [Nitrolancea sp.]|nr:hypothetical protein [Nitrolancea sp.]